MTIMKNAGFSLVEMLVVIAIMGILIGIAGISGKAWMDKYGVEAQTKEMFVDFMNARASAMSKNRMHFVSLPTTARYIIYEDTNPGPDGNGTLEDATACPACDRQVMLKDLNYPITIPENAGQIDFDSRGLASAVPGPLGAQKNVRVTSSLGAASNCIAITATRIRVGAWNETTCVAQ